MRCIGREMDGIPFPLIAAWSRAWSIFHLVIPGRSRFNSSFENEPENIERICSRVWEVSAWLYASTNSSTRRVSHFFWFRWTLRLVQIAKFSLLKRFPNQPFLARCKNKESCFNYVLQLFQIVGLLSVRDIFPMKIESWCHWTAPPIGDLL